MPKYVVRYGSMRQLGVMSSRPEALRRGDRVVARTPRGIELGEVLCEATEDALSHLDEPTQGQILRLFSEEDAEQAAKQAAQGDSIYDTCRKRIAEESLPMKLVDVEQVLGGDRIVVYYVSEDRVDFRNLVKLLATDLKSRIEMRQIGVRDEAKLLADYGDCGKPVCCNTHLSKMPPVSMKMAKLQKATLDPNKISGRCGRLKCCLRYEYDTYEAIVKDLPSVGSEIVTREGKARVLAQEILSEQLLVETEDMRRKMVHSSEVLSVLRRGSNRQARSGGRRPPMMRDDGDSQSPSETDDSGIESQADELQSNNAADAQSRRPEGGRHDSQRSHARPDRRGDRRGDRPSPNRQHNSAQGSRAQNPTPPNTASPSSDPRNNSQQDSPEQNELRDQASSRASESEALTLGAEFKEPREAAQPRSPQTFADRPDRSPMTNDRPHAADDDLETDGDESYDEDDGDSSATSGADEPQQGRGRRRRGSRGRGRGRRNEEHEPDSGSGSSPSSGSAQGSADAGSPSQGMQAPQQPDSRSQAQQSDDGTRPVDPQTKSGSE